MALARAHVYVTGYVQGVFYRHTTAQRARDRGLTGWVRNLPDGRVEAVLEGEESDVRDVVAWCGSGPAHATVERVDVEWEPPESGFSGFRIL
ncbi:MAG: acylphosphatase [Actinomycetota bacterium]